MDEVLSYGEWLKGRRKQLGLTQGELAERAGCSISAIRKIESGIRRPSRQVAELIARVLEVPADRVEKLVRIARGERRAGPQFFRELTGEEVSALEEGAGPVQTASLPMPVTPLIGRGPELSQIQRLLLSDNCRLVTIVGPGGIGKTRFAIEAAHAVAAEFAQGAVFVPLASVSSPGLIASAIGQALGLSFHGTGRSEDRLIAELADREMLLVLDNMEHLIGGAGIVTAILLRTQKIKLLITSLARLNLQGEWSFEITGLPVPPAGRLERIEEYSSVRLFLEAAKRSDRDYRLHRGDEKWVSLICQLTEGMPLAIELAASWVRLLSCEEIAREIGQNLDFLSSETANMPDRHRSIRAVFDYAWGLLAPDEQKIFSRLSVFQGGFRREAAEHVASARLKTLSRLVDRSLLRRTPARRYEIHEILRSYALERLKADPEDFLDARTRHCRFYSAWLASLEESIRGENQIAALFDISLEIDNVRLAWNWAISHSLYAEIRQAIPSLSAFYELRGWYQEGAETFQRAVDLFCAGRPGGCESTESIAEVEHTLTYGRLIAHHANFLYLNGQRERALQGYQRAFELLGSIHDEAGQADMLHGIAQVYLGLGDFEAAKQSCLRSLETGQRFDDDWNSIQCHTLAGIIHFSTGEYEQAKAHFEQGLAYSNHVVDLRCCILSLAYQGRIAAIEKNFTRAGQLLEAGMALGQKTEDPSVLGVILSFLGMTAAEQGDFDRARDWLQASHRQFAVVHDAQALEDVDRYLEIVERQAHPAVTR